MAKLPSPRECGLPEKFERWRPGQEDALSGMLNSSKRASAVCAPTGFGKCFSGEVPILLYNGNIKYADAIEIGDILIGPDSYPRTVISTTSGSDELFTVTPTKGGEYTVNSNHILCLQITSDGKSQRGTYLVDIPVSEYLSRSRTFKHRAKGYRSTSVTFSGGNPDLPISPYFLGLWLGDETSNAPDITTADEEIESYLREFADSLGMRLKSKRGRSCPTYGLRNKGVGHRWATNPVTDILRDLDVFGSKSIPMMYKRSTVEQRLELLAGLVDSDGYVLKGCIEISQKNRRLARDIVFVARSVGLAAYDHPGDKSDQYGTSGYYHRIIISGNTYRIRTRLERKQAEYRNQKKDTLVTGVTVKSSGRGTYFGFSLTGPDQRFLLGDFTVAHNSPVYAATALLSQKPTCIVTNSRALQDQLMTDYKSIGMVDIRGRNNYTCGMKEDTTCEDGYASRCIYKGTIACPSSQAEMRAATSSLVVTNYSKWIAAKKFGQGMAHFQQVIFDEGHNAAGALAQAMQVILNHREIEEKLEVDFLPYPDASDMANWKIWAQAVRVIAENEMTKAYARIQGISDPKPSWVRHFSHMRNLVRRLSILSTCRAVDWVVDEIEQGFQFDPIRPARYAESTLLLKVPRIIVTSATLRPKSMFMIGLGQANFDFKDYPSNFDPKKCPIYYIPTMRVDSKAKDLSPLWVKLDQIASRRRDRNGMIHTVSHQRREDIMRLSRYAGSMIFNERGETASEAIKKFKASYPGAILVSPSIEEGYDFPGKEAEWGFMCKIPFEPPSKIVKAREADDPEYRAYQAMQRLVQAPGRIVRSDKDRAEFFICDQHLDWFLPRYQHLAPKWFHSFFTTVKTVPPPPERLA